MSNPRILARVAGLLYLATFVTSIPALALKRPFLAGSAGASAAQGASALEIVLALCCIGTAVVLYPVTRRVDQALALGFVASRVLEAAMVFVGVIALLALSTLRTGGPTAADSALVAVHDWAFLIGPGLLPGVNAALLGTILLRGRLVPRWIPLLGLVGAPLLIASALGVLVGAFSQVSPAAGLLALPIAAWELCLGLRLTVAGFRAGPVEALLPVAQPAPLTVVAG